MRIPLSLAPVSTSWRSALGTSSSVAALGDRLVDAVARGCGLPGQRARPRGRVCPRTRSAIRGWQSARGTRTTGYLDGPQVATLRGRSGFQSPASASAAAADSGGLEVVFWQSIANSTNPTDFEAYLRRFPTGVFSELAQNRLAAMRGAARSPSAAAGSSAGGIGAPPSGSRVSGAPPRASASAAGGDARPWPGAVFSPCSNVRRAAGRGGLVRVCRLGNVRQSATTGYLDGPQVATLRGRSGFQSPASASAAAADSGGLEVVFWQSIANSTNPTDFEAYLRRFPTGVFSELAQNRLAAMRGAARSPSAAAGSSAGGIGAPPSGSRVSGAPPRASASAAGGDARPWPGAVFSPCSNVRRAAGRGGLVRVCRLGNVRQSERYKVGWSGTTTPCRTAGSSKATRRK